MIETAHSGHIDRSATPSSQRVAMTDGGSPWLTVNEAAARARCGIKTIYREVKANRLKAAKVGGRRELRLRAEWVDAWLELSVV